MSWCENLDFFCVEKSVFLVSAENGDGVNKITNITYASVFTSFHIIFVLFRKSVVSFLVCVGPI